MNIARAREASQADLKRTARGERHIIRLGLFAIYTLTT
jgi:hypothetical protein